MRAGFDVEEVNLDYEGQYILLTAHPAAQPYPQHTPEAKTIHDLCEITEAFAGRVESNTSMWSDILNALQNNGRKGDVWGSGSKGVAFLTSVPNAELLSRVVDINPYRQGKFMPGTGQEIVAPGALLKEPPDCVIVMNPVYSDEIWQDLQQRKLQPWMISV